MVHYFYHIILILLLWFGILHLFYLRNCLATFNVVKLAFCNLMWFLYSARLYTKNLVSFLLVCIVLFCTVTSFSFSPFCFFTFIWCWGRTVIMSQIGSRKRIRLTNLPPGESTSRKHGATPSTQSQCSKPPQINLSLMAPCKPGKKTQLPTNLRSPEHTLALMFDDLAN